MSRAVMQKALEALEVLDRVMQRSERTNSAITALRQALAEPEQHDTDCHLQGICQRSGYSIAPTPRKPVELTDEQIVQVLGSARESITGSVFLAFARAIIAEYEDKNGIGEQHE